MSEAVKAPASTPASTPASPAVSTLASPPVSALINATCDGSANIQECGLQGMITLRGDLTSKGLKSAVVKAAGGAKMPKTGTASMKDDSGLCWMSPDELLILCPYGEVTARLEALNTRLAGEHCLAVNVSDARAVFSVSGPLAREVLARLCPVDLSPDAFRAGMFRRTRMAQVAAAFRLDDAGVFHIICFRSVADYVFDLLKSAAQPGPQVGFF